MLPKKENNNAQIKYKDYLRKINKEYNSKYNSDKDKETIEQIDKPLNIKSEPESSNIENKYIFSDLSNNNNSHIPNPPDYDYNKITYSNYTLSENLQSEDEYMKNMTMSVKKPYTNDEIKIQKNRTYGEQKNSDIFDSKVKNKKLLEYSLILDEKINSLKKKLNLLGNPSIKEEEKINTMLNNKITSDVTNNLLTSNFGENIDDDNIQKNDINMDSFDFNNLSMDQPLLNHQIQVSDNNICNSLLLKTQRNREKQIKLSYEKFLSLNKNDQKFNPAIIILSFLNTNDTFQIFQSNIKIKYLFISSLKNEIKTITSRFEHITRNLMNDHSFYIGLAKNLLRKELKIFLILKSRIICERLINKSLHMQYFAHFPCDKKQFVQNTFVFDIKNSPLTYWAMKESTNFNEDELNKAYFMNVMQFAIGDFVELTINLFTDKGLMDIKKFVWNKITVFKTPKEDFLNYSNENILKREIVDFDTSRYCEMELCKGKWNDINLLENNDTFIENVKKKLIEFFDIQKILFDNVGYYIFKIYLKGKKQGKIEYDNELGINIKIIEKGCDKSNEAKKNNLLFDRKNEIQLHIGDTLVFYITRNV